MGQHAAGSKQAQLLQLLLPIMLLCCTVTAVKAQTASCGVAICFSLDESGSITQGGFNNATMFMKTLVTSLANVSSECVLIHH